MLASGAGPLLPSVDEFSAWNEEQVVDFLLTHSKDIDELTHELIFSQQLTGKILVEKDAKSLKEMGMALKQAVLLKAIVKRIINGSSSSTDNLSASRKAPVTPSENSVSQICESARLQFEEMFECERRYGKLESYEELGRGSFGTVYRVSCVKKKEERALKVIFSKTKKEINESFSEAFQLIKVNHEHIVKVYDAFMSGWKEENEEKDVVCMEMEYMKHGSLWDYYLKRNQTAIPEEVIFSIIHQVSTSLKYLQEHFKLVHRDIKPGNILIKKLEGNIIHVCLGDFGLAKTYNHGSTVQSSVVGTESFLSPEIYQAKYAINQNGQSKNVYTEQSDVFALGMTIYQLMTGDFKSHGATLSNSGIVRKELVSKMKLQYNDNLIDLVVDVMNADPTKRPGLDQLIQTTHLETGDLYIGFSFFEKREYSNALQCFTKASEGGNMIAHWFLGFMYENGLVSDLKSDFSKAVQFYQRSYLKPIESNENFATRMMDAFTKQNNSSGQHNLGRMFEIGFGVPQDYSKAIEFYLKSAQKYNSNAYNSLGIMYLNGYGVDMNHASAFEWFQKSANKKGGPDDINGNLFKMFENGNSMGQCNLGRLLEPNLFSEPGVNKDFSKSMKWYEISAKQGNPNAQNYLALIYKNGKGIAKDLYKAFNWFEISAKQGNADAQYNLALMHKNGEGTAKDFHKANEWYEMSAKQGSSKAQYYLALRYYNGEGVEQDFHKAFEYFEKSAKQGDPNAQYHLAVMYKDGEGVEQDFLKAIEWFEKSAKQGDSNAQHSLALMYKDGEGTAKDFYKAFEWFEKSAKRGHANAQYNMAVMYKNGEGIAKDLRKAFEWFAKSAKQGHANAQNYLGVAYYNGEGVEKDFNKAFKWFERSAKQGQSNAQYYLAVMYKNGNGAEKHVHKAFELFEKSAVQGDQNAQYNLAVMYKNGQGIETDLQKAFEWFEKSAKQGNSNAQNYLASMYRTGEGIEQDFYKAFEWFEKAANQGDSYAQNLLGVAYKNGEGIEKDIHKAFKWFEKSAKQGEKYAQHNVAYMYMNGIGVKKDQDKAIEWWKKAAQQGHQKAQFYLNSLTDK